MRRMRIGEVRFYPKAPPALKPCPFCGGVPEIQKADTVRAWRIRCRDCSIGTDFYGQEADPAEVWNHRMPDAR